MGLKQISDRRLLEDLHVTIRGAGHIKKRAICQDYSKSYSLKDSAAAAVADGHGDIRYFRSASGARFAVESALKAIRVFVRSERNPGPDSVMDEKMAQLKKNIILNWNLRIKKHLAEHPFTDEELAPLSETRRNFLKNGNYVETAYGTTLIAAAATPFYWFGLQIGDGDCIAAMEDGTLRSIPKENGLVANITTSLCEADAIEKFHHICSTEKPASILLSTDGVKNSFRTQKNYLDFMQKIVQTFQDEGNCATQKYLKEFLRDMTANGSGDDLSIAGIIKNRETE
jgi:serine/threonine protein phosphatase PrpC